MVCCSVPEHRGSFTSSSLRGADGKQTEGWKSCLGVKSVTTDSCSPDAVLVLLKCVDAAECRFRPLIASTAIQRTKNQMTRRLNHYSSMSNG
nr:MAG TPA: hypothetical protein [Caudoviricetes sp.]